MSTEPRTPTPAEDDADRHVAHWRDHWIDIEFDDTVEAIVERMGRIMRYLKHAGRGSVAELGLEWFEYDTLHNLMIRDTPGVASPSELATKSGVSPAGMTGRLDTLEKAGYVRRRTVEGDRRRVEVEATAKGIKSWRKAMTLRGNTEVELMGALDEAERLQLSDLLRRLTLAIESEGRSAP
ncbi:MarR family winged helix-turn-helix transcriptional regulator [Solicola gregarius]|uniref:MarR family transcriptional regulator n=1 Tax=Solicola gregarius TaxID=2908642 RepID=A0AA46TGI2_9ACTN|nr:MarR family transcriptional regulator [Solicola gregarius]UYM04701.1 MarR family transcriptional regulator [Solicola gregarius]